MKRNSTIAALFFLAALPLGAISADSAKPANATPPARDVPATAAAPKEEPAPLFKELDSNHDGYVTKEEARRSAEITARFQELDSDHDGRVATAEFKKGMQPKL